MKKSPTCARNHFRTSIPRKNKKTFCFSFPNFILKWGKKFKNCFKNICCEEKLPIKLIDEHFLTALMYGKRLLQFNVGILQEYLKPIITLEGALEKQASWHCLTAVQTVRKLFFKDRPDPS